jgi:hypothetical protein
MTAPESAQDGRIEMCWNVHCKSPEADRHGGCVADCLFFPRKYFRYRMVKKSWGQNVMLAVAPGSVAFVARNDSTVALNLSSVRNITKPANTPTPTIIDFDSPSE